MATRADATFVRAYAEAVACCCHLWPTDAAVDEVEAILWRLLDASPPPGIVLDPDLPARCHTEYLTSRRLT